MKITATDKRVVVRFRTDGKAYGSSGGEVDNGLTPFDEQWLEPGQEFDSAGSTVIGVAESDGNAQDADSPA